MNRVLNTVSAAFRFLRTGIDWFNSRPLLSAIVAVTIVATPGYFRVEGAIDNVAREQQKREESDRRQQISDERNIVDRCRAGNSSRNDTRNMFKNLFQLVPDPNERRLLEDRLRGPEIQDFDCTDPEGIGPEDYERPP